MSDSERQLLHLLSKLRLKRSQEPFTLATLVNTARQEDVDGVSYDEIERVFTNFIVERLEKERPGFMRELREAARGHREASERLTAARKLVPETVAYRIVNKETQYAPQTIRKLIGIE